MTPALVVPVLGRKLYPGASVALDFTRNLYRSGTPVVKGSPSLLSGWTFTRASTGYAETAAGALVAFASGEPRITDKGLLVEEARTNLLLRSQEFDNASWSISQVAVTANAAIAPDGTLTADKVQSTGTGPFTQSASVASSAASFSVYARIGSGATHANSFMLRNTTSATNLVGCTINYSTGAIAYTVGSSGVSAQQLAGGWWRIIITASSGITSADNLTCYVGFTGAGTSGHYVYLWGAQLEAGAFPTSYIPTTTASATRAADVGKLAGLSLPAPQTFIAVATIAPGVTTDARISLTDGTANNRFYIKYDGTNVTTQHLGNNVGVDSAIQAKAADSTLKDGSSFDGTTARFARDGAAATSVAGTAWTANLSQLEFGNVNYAGGRYWNSYIQRVLIYPTAFTGAQLTAATT